VAPLPTLIATGQNYSFNVPLPATNATPPITLHSACGPVVSNVTSGSSTFFPITSNATCTFTSSGLTVWYMTVLSFSNIFNRKFVFIQNQFNLFIGQKMNFILPTREQVISLMLSSLELASNFIYTVTPNLPPGLQLDEQRGTISGTAAAESQLQTYTFLLYDSFSKLSQSVGKISIGVSPLPMGSPSSTVNPAAYAVPIGVVVLAAIIAWLVFRHQQRKLFHIFISYRLK
jgi:hypothetical protein